jgi:hypothetical protein
MNGTDEDEPTVVDDFDPVGLCRTCIHAKVITTPRGSTFYLCHVSETDPRFPKYPVLPVTRCSGYTVKKPPKTAEVFAKKTSAV